MKESVFTFIAALGLVLALGQQVSAQADPSTPLRTSLLLSWNDGADQKPIIEFITKVMKEDSPNFVKPAASRKRPNAAGHL